MSRCSMESNVRSKLDVLGTVSLLPLTSATKVRENVTSRCQVLLSPLAATMALNVITARKVQS